MAMGKTLTTEVYLNMFELMIACGPAIHGGGPHDMAQAWESAGFTVDDVIEWTNAGCYTVDGARQLRDAGLTPEQAGLIVPNTIGYYVEEGHWTVEDAVTFVSLVKKTKQAEEAAARMVAQKVKGESLMRRVRERKRELQNGGD